MRWMLNAYKEQENFDKVVNHTPLLLRFLRTPKVDGLVVYGEVCS